MILSGRQPPRTHFLNFARLRWDGYCLQTGRGLKCKSSRVTLAARQTAAAARVFFVDLMEFGEWKVFSQILAKDHGELPAVMILGGLR